MNIQLRLRNKAFILSAVAFIVLMIKSFTNYQLPDNFDMLVNTALTLLSAMGIVLDPTTPSIGDKVSETTK